MEKFDDSPDDHFGSEIAVIGMNGRFPGARDVDEFWRNLRDGVESITFFSDEEVLAAGMSPALLNNPDYVKAGAVLDDIESFDAPFFGFTPREAETMDPQHRLFLQGAWAALENAGYDSETYDGSIGVYAGVGMNLYLFFNLYPRADLVGSVLQTRIGNDKDFLTTRVSYKLNLKGPSVNVQTACSTSLVAVHMACQSLLNRECSMALAGGVSVTVPHRAGYVYQEGGIASPDGHCRAFDARARGTVGGSGLGIVVLKRLSDALADGDCIHAVIKGSAVNNDGSVKIGYTAPSVDGQADVIAEALAVAGVEPDSISYIEAHGTGTALGDPVEIAALTKVFRAGTRRRGFCAIGSVKTNVGHLDVAAGVTGLIKTVLSLKHRLLPPSLNFESPNPKIDFAGSPFYVNAELAEWRAGDTPRRAGVSSFGVGGTNAHVILEEAPAAESSCEARPWQLLVLSARTDAALAAATSNLAAHLRQNPELNFADVAYTLQVGRRAFDHRRVLVCRDADEAAAALEAQDPRKVLTASHEPMHRPVVFMFPGQGTQYPGMGRELYETEPTFREQVDYCSDILRPHLGFDLRGLLYPTDAGAEEAAKKLNQTFVAQPALFTVEYALARLWMEWGVRPEAMIGHSVGEYVAACLAGVFSPAEALALIAARGSLMQKLPPGGMAAVLLSEDEIRPLLRESLNVAAVNGPSLCVVSGPEEALGQLEEELARRGVGCRRLHTSHAFHSAMMEPALGPFRDKVSNVRLRRPEIPYLSNLTGDWITEAQATDPEYWARHMRGTVRFAEGLGELLKEPNNILLEVGPGQALSSLAKQHPHRAAGQVVLTSMRHPRERRSDCAFMLDALGQLWLAGGQVGWQGLHAHERRRRVPLPTYPFETRPYWVEPRAQTRSAAEGPSAPGKRPDVAEWFYAPSWKRSLRPAASVPGGEAGRDACCLLLCDEGEFRGLMLERLSRRVRNVVAVRAGDEFIKHDDRAYTINPRRRGDYESLSGELRALGMTPEMILHLWSAAPTEAARTGQEFFEESQYLGYYSLIFLANAFGQKHTPGALQIMLVTNGARDVTGEESLRPEQATALGVSRVIPQEFQNIVCRNLDISADGPGPLRDAALADDIVAELFAAPSDSDVAYRRGRRWVQTFEAVRPDEGAGADAPLREGGVYLITGGLGAIGLTLAEHLGATLRAKLALTTRSPFPRREEWGQWLADHDESDEVSRKVRRLQRVEAAGAEVVVLVADAADAGQMRDALAAVDARFGTLHGVVHAAGVVAGESFRGVREVDDAGTEVHFRPKARGLYVLERVLRGRQLDFCLLMSSLSGILGGLNLAAYASANAFMDAFAHMMNRRGRVLWRSVNWDAWRLRAEQQRGVDIGAALSELAILPEEGMRAFRLALSPSDAPQLVVSTGDLQTRINQWVKLESLREEGRNRKAAAPPSRRRPYAGDEYAAPLDEVERRIADTWRELLGIEQIGADDNFFELGGHSLLALQLVQRLRNEFDVELSVQRFFESPTVAGLAEVIKGAAAEGAADPDGAASARHGSPLVALQREGSGLPFFCVHPSGGIIFPYIMLAKHIGGGRPFYAIRPEGAAEGDGAGVSLESMAAGYVEALRSAQPEGPYMLGGWSLGAIIAFEMAQQLRRGGQQVALLAMLDDGPDYHALYDPEYFANLDDAATLLHMFGEYLPVSSERLRRLSPEGRLAYVIEEAAKTNIVPRGLEPQQLRDFIRLNRAHARARFAYVLKEYPGRVTLFRASEELRKRPAGRSLGWERFAAGGVDVHMMPGDHWSMVVDRSNVVALAEGLRACLDRAQETAAAESLPVAVRL